MLMSAGTELEPVTISQMICIVNQIQVHPDDDG
jgi:hypothetical protein